MIVAFYHPGNNTFVIAKCLHFFKMHKISESSAGCAVLLICRMWFHLFSAFSLLQSEENELSEVVVYCRSRHTKSLNSRVRTFYQNVLFHLTNLFRYSVQHRTTGD